MSVFESDSTFNEEGVSYEPIIEIDAETVYINRPWVRKYFNGSTIDRVEGKSVKPKKALTDEQRAEIARKRRIMEIERRKALKAAALRNKKNFSVNSKSGESILVRQVTLDAW